MRASPRYEPFNTSAFSSTNKFWDLSNTGWREVSRVSRAWEFLMAWKDKRKLAEGSRQEEFEEFLRDQVSKTPPSYCEIYGLHISGRNKLSGQKRGYFTNSFSGFLLFLNKLQIVSSMAFKLPFLKGKCNSDGSLDCHGLPLFAWKQLRDKEEAIGRGSYGLVCTTFYAVTKTHGKFSITKSN